VTVRVFVSYRRDDSKHAAGRLGERLDERFKLFMDVDQIQGGAVFPAVVRKAVDEADVLLAVIGSEWLTLTAASGGRRIDQAGDWVAEEIGSALLRGTPVIPVLVDGARMPSSDELPPALADLANRQAMRIAHESFAADSARLIQTIESMVSEAKPEDVNLWDDPDYPRARAAFLQGLWPQAIEGFERVLRRHARQPNVVEQLGQARRNQHLLDLDATAERATEAGRWREVVDALEGIVALQPSDDIKDRLTQARLRLRVNELQNDIRALAKTGAWAAVLAADTELAGLEPGAGDPDGLTTKARAELLQAELAASYAEGIQRLGEGNWAAAEAIFRALLDRQPSYRDVQALLALAGRKGRAEEKREPPPEPAATKPVPTDSVIPQGEVGQLATPNRKASAGEEAEDHVRRQKEAEDHARRLGEEQARRIEEEAARPPRKEQRRRDTHPLLRSPRQQAARLLSRRWVVILAVSVGIGGALLLLIWLVRPQTIMGQLPADVRSSCSTTDNASATCNLPDRTVVFYRLFDTASEARAYVVNGGELAPDGTPCPPSSAPPAETPVVCSYEAGAETGVAAFSQTVKAPLGFYDVRWNPGAHSRLLGVMTTKNTAQGWERLRSNWTRLAEME
jgi:tetratricopeptide (TPR) repeat protein